MASEQPIQRRPLKPNPKRQLTLVALALLGLAIGYGLGFVFKPTSAPQIGKKSVSPAHLSTKQKAKLVPNTLLLPPPNVVLPENVSTRGGEPVRAYEEALPTEVVVTVEQLGISEVQAAVAPRQKPLQQSATIPTKVKLHKKSNFISFVILK